MTPESNNPWHEESERLREGVLAAIDDGSDDEFLLLREPAGKLLAAGGVCSETDLSWWCAGGHKPEATADYRAMPLYLLYKIIGYGAKIDRDAGERNPRLIREVVTNVSHRDGFGLYLSLKLNLKALTSPPTELSRSLEAHMDTWLGKAGGIPEKIVAISAFLEGVKATKAPALVNWVATQGILDRGMRCPFLPMHELDAKWEKGVHRAFDAIFPYARAIGGAAVCEILCHWTEFGSTLSTKIHTTGL